MQKRKPFMAIEGHCPRLSGLDLAVPELAKEVACLKSSIISLGYNNKNVLMPFSTLGLAVSPALKITDVGLIDVANQKVVPLIID